MPLAGHAGEYLPQVLRRRGRLGFARGAVLELEKTLARGVRVRHVAVVHQRDVTDPPPEQGARDLRGRYREADMYKATRHVGAMRGLHRALVA